MKDNKLRVYSGTCCKCDVGMPTGEKDMNGHDLFTGDVVQLWHGNFLGTDLEEWYPNTGLTVIIANQYQSYTNGTIETVDEKPKPFTMGIFDAGVQNEEWKVIIVKPYTDIVSGERFKSFGINFK